MLGLSNAKSSYETPDSRSVNDFIANIDHDDVDGGNDYEMPDQESVKRFAGSMKNRDFDKG